MPDIKVNSHCIVTPADEDDPIAQEWNGFKVVVSRLHAANEDYAHVELVMGDKRVRAVFRVKDLKPI